MGDSMSGHHNDSIPTRFPATTRVSCWRAIRSTLVLTGCSLACFLAANCGTSSAKVAPTIEFTVVPPADPGGPDTLAPVAGRVKGAHANQRVVLFARSGGWWVQPYRTRPFTSIEKDSAWTSSIHLGTEYAALLVEPAYRPPVSTEFLPRPGGDIVAMATVKGSGAWVPPAPKTIAFSGYDWQIVQVRIDRHGPNDGDARNVSVDSEGRLHLLLAQREGRWTSAMLSLTRALGYGTYIFTVRDTSKLDPSAALLMYTWDDRADHNHRELNVSIGNWGNPRDKNAQYVLQHEDIAANVSRFSAPSGRLTHAIKWEPGAALFTTVRGADAASAGQPVARQRFTTGVPEPSTATVRLGLLYAHEAPNPPARNVEVVVEKFVYLP
jgi:hypothetical protein